MPRPSTDFLSRLLREARASAGLSQRALAARAGVPASTIAGAESGDRDLATSALTALLEACGWDLVVVDASGQPVTTPMPCDPRRDAAGRRYPAHVVVRSTAPRGSWWADRWGIFWGVPPRPPWTYDLPTRDRRTTEP